MNDLEQAISVASFLHTGQVDKQGVPYILHPLRVMQDVLAMGLDREGEYGSGIVAVLHDVLEDTGIKPDWLQERFGPEIAHKVLVLTRQRRLTQVSAFSAPMENYSTYIARIKESGQPCVTVKIKDILDNLSRMHQLAKNDEGMAQRLTYRYGLALEQLGGGYGPQTLEIFGPTVTRLFKQAEANHARPSDS